MKSKSSPAEKYLAPAIKKGGGTREENKYRGTKVCDKSGKKERRRGSIQIRGVIVHRTQVKIIPYVVQCHHHHHYASKDIQRDDSGTFSYGHRLGFSQSYKFEIDCQEISFSNFQK